MRKAAIIALNFLLPCWHSAVALDAALDVNQYGHTAWRIREGFISSEIHAIAQTTDGYLWLGTDSGLFRFDGVRTVPWVPPRGESLPDTHIRALLGTRDGTLWIGTWAGLASLKDSRLTSYPQLAGWSINDLLEDHEGAVWAGASSAELSDGRLCSIHSGSVHCDGGDGRFAQGVSCLHEDTNGQLWVNSAAGLWQWNSRTPRLRSLSAEILDSLQALADGEDGALLVVTRSGTLRVLGETVEVLPAGLPSVPLRDILRDRDGALWIGTHDRGLLHVHRGRVDAFDKSDGFAGQRVSRIFEDREGNLWVATDEGLNRFHDVAAATYSVEQGLSSPNVVSLLTTRDGNLWISTTNGLNRWRGGEITVYAQRDIPPQARIAPARAVSETDHSGLPNGAGSLSEDTHGRIWVGSQKGLGYLENDRYIAIKGVSNGFIDAITQDPGGTVWVAHRDLGLLRLSADQVVERIPWVQLGHQKEARRLAIDPRPNSLWLGFLLGGVAHFVDGRVLQFYSVHDGLAAGRVHDLRLDPDGTVWVAAEGGLSRITPGGIATLTSRSGLPCDAVNWTLRDGAGALWVYTGCGIARIERTELGRWEASLASGSGSGIRAKVMDSSVGTEIAVPGSIGSASPQVARSQDGRIWFATTAGVGVLDPNNLHINRLVPPVHIEQITADRQSYSPVSSLRLPAQVRDLEIDYTALSLVAPEKNQFRYMLEGYDRDWQDVGNRRQAFYNGRPPGNYRFRVIASNNSAVWNEQGATLDFTIAPAYWQTVWFRTLCVAVAVALVWMIYRLRVRQLAREFDMKLEARVDERTRIARELHDTLLQSFQGLLLRFQAVAKRLPEGSERQKLASAIADASHAIGEGRNAIEHLRPPTAEKDLASALQCIGDELAGKSGEGPTPAFQVDVHGTPRDLHPIVRDEIYRIAREALHNAFQHAQAHHIEVGVRYDERRLVVSVRDDGRGIETEVMARGARSGHFGLRGMHERSRILGAHLDVWTRPDSGTEVELSIPASVAYESSRSRARFSRLTWIPWKKATHGD